MQYKFAFITILEVLRCIEARLREMGYFDSFSLDDRVQLQNHYRMIAMLITVTFKVSPLEEEFAMERVFVDDDGALRYDLADALKAREEAFPVVIFGEPREPS